MRYKIVPHGSEVRGYLPAVEELLQDPPNTEVREVDIAV